MKVTFAKIIGGDFDNHGDHLMLIATVTALRGFEPRPQIVSSILGPSTYADRCALGLYQCADPFNRSRRLCLANTLGRLLVLRYGSLYGIVPDERIQMFFDMSGYAYADRWTIGPIRERTKYYKRLKAQGKRIIMLPQAFGPFETCESKNWMRSLLAHVDLVFARDELSFQQVLDLAENKTKVKLAPEFTQLLQPPPDLSQDGDELGNLVAIVPNIQMIRQGATSYEMYQNFLIAMIRAVEYSGCEPIVLQFSRQADAELVERIKTLCPALRIIRSSDPLTLKRILGKCRAAICSRYHSLISAYSQGVPAATTAWSHKYLEFARDYGMEDFVIAPDDPYEKLQEIVKQLAITRHQELSAALVETSQRQQALVRKMWETIAGFVEVELPKNADISMPSLSCLTQ